LYRWEIPNNNYNKGFYCTLCGPHLKRVRLSQSFRLETGENKGLADPPSKIQMGPQRAVAGVGTSKSGVGTDEVVHAAIIFSSLTQVLQLLTTSSYPRRPHHQLSHCNFFSISYFLNQHFWFISPHFFLFFSSA